MKTGSIVEVYSENLYLGRGMVTEAEKNGIVKVETFDGSHYSCDENELEIINE